MRTIDNFITTIDRREREQLAEISIAIRASQASEGKDFEKYLASMRKEE